jgi:hypothetical protein
MKIPHLNLESSFFGRRLNPKILPSDYDALGLECSDCKMTCGSLRDPEAIEACLQNCYRQDGPCVYVRDQSD